MIITISYIKVLVQIGDANGLNYALYNNQMIKNDKPLCVNFVTVLIDVNLKIKFIPFNAGKALVIFNCKIAYN